MSDDCDAELRGFEPLAWLCTNIPLHLNIEEATVIGTCDPLGFSAPANLEAIHILVATMAGKGGQAPMESISKWCYMLC